MVPLEGGQVNSVPLTVADGRLRARLGTATNDTHSAPAVTGARIDDGKLSNDSWLRLANYLVNSAACQRDVKFYSNKT